MSFDAMAVPGSQEGNDVAAFHEVSDDGGEDLVRDNREVESSASNTEAGHHHGLPLPSNATNGSHVHRGIHSNNSAIIGGDGGEEGRGGGSFSYPTSPPSSPSLPSPEATLLAAHARQYELEARALDTHLREYRSTLTDLIALGRGAALPFSQRLLVSWFGPLALAIDRE